MNLENIKKIYISGIGGIGVSALARFFVCKGIEVVGSDAEKSEVTEALEKIGIKIYYDQKAENVTYANDLFVYSSAVPSENPERQKAKELKIVQKSYFEVLGEISRDYNTVAVSGTNGKSSTTAMLAAILLKADKDPSVILGSCFDKLDNNFHCGKSDLLVVEACEYRAHMLLLKSQTIILTNIEEDHLDFYKDLNHIVQTFQQYVNGLRLEDNLLVLNNDDVNIRKLNLPKCKIVKFGLIHGADVWADNIRKLPAKQLFNVIYYGQDLGEFELNVPGDFNIYNALAAIGYALTLNIPIGVVKDALREFKGIWRRFEIIKNEKYTVISDYAHHPTAIQETIKAVREFMPGRRIVAVFQPHQRDRTQKLFDDFVKSFDLADVVIMPEIYDVEGREEGQKISSQDLVSIMSKEKPNKQIEYAEDLMEARVKAKSTIKDEDVVLVMGAGDVYKIVEKI
ncbi:UDP-N-acetylmuramate--L-alanine ligase [Candidatus Kuenenbacteria bacterium]|nr:UDP-N-acetylmuramate--L-alanine ligase [Candidatus Kuenenbacteria bacterium]